MSSATPSVFPGVGLGIQTDFFNIALGDFINNDDLYFGVKFDISANTHYGWVRVKVDTLAGSGIIYDFAYQSIADSSILAGDTESGFIGVEVNLFSTVSIYNANNKIHVNSDVNRGVISVYNLLGKQVINSRVNKVDIISVGHLTKGIYLVSFSDGRSNITKKIFVE